MGFLKKLERETRRVFGRHPSRPRIQPAPVPPAPAPEPPPPEITPPTPETTPLETTPPPRKKPQFLFPETQSTVLPDPSQYFAPNLLLSPLPTNSFFQNFVLKKGDQPEYIHPYLIKSSLSSITICYPTLLSTTSAIHQTFTPDLTIFTAQDHTHPTNHTISSFNDLSLTLDLPANLRFFLVRGSPFVTFSTLYFTNVSISTVHAILSLTSNPSLTRHKILLNNNQTWLIYSSAPLHLNQNTSLLTADGFTGLVRIAVLPDIQSEHVLDRFSACYPVAGDAKFARPFCLEYKWEKKGWGDLLLLAHPLHLRLLSVNDCKVTILEELKYRSIDGELIGVVGDSWVLRADPISVTWHSIGGIEENHYPEIINALQRDVEGLNSSPITTTSPYFYGKAIARAARLALIAEEVCFPDAIPPVKIFLHKAITPWLEGTFDGNAFLYDTKWGGIVSRQGSLDTGVDFGFGIYNDHHYQLGYFLYAIAVLSKIDPLWRRRYWPQAYSLMADFMTLGRHSESNYTRLRCFDLWKLHSWAGGLTEFADGRNQESTSEAVNAYYSAALMGLSYGDTHLVSIGSTLAAFEIRAAQMWWHVREGEGVYMEEFSRENRMVGVLWNNKRDSGLWFAPRDWRECRMGIHVLPLLPITEILFSDVEFVRELVKWVVAALDRKGVGDGWRGFVYAIEAIYDKDAALEKTKTLNGFDDGNSLSNLLWWMHSRVAVDHKTTGEGFIGGGRLCSFGHYCH